MAERGYKNLLIQEFHDSSYIVYNFFQLDRRQQIIIHIFR